MSPATGMHFLTGSDTTSYLHGKGKPALKTLLKDDFDGLYIALGKIGASHNVLMGIGEAFITPLYELSPGTFMADARYHLYTRKRGKPKIMALPPKNTKLFLHILRAHHAVTLGKAADQKDAPDLDLTKLGWEINVGFPVAAITKGHTGPQQLTDVISCNYKATGKACSTHS